MIEFRSTGRKVHSEVFMRKIKTKTAGAASLNTATTTELAMIPVALGVAEGAELMQGMAIVIIGGLFASTVLTLLLIPTFYLLLDRFHRGKYVRQAEERKAL